MFSRKARRRFKQLLLWAEILFILVMGAGVGVVAGAFYQMSKLLPPDRRSELPAGRRHQVLLLGRRAPGQHRAGEPGPGRDQEDPEAAPGRHRRH